MNRRVLLIDDDDLIREVTQAALELIGGWQVITSAGAAERGSRSRSTSGPTWS